MARIKIEDYDEGRHRHPMAYIDDPQSERSTHARSLIPRKVCLVDVCGFTFTFHNLTQLRLCVDFYSREHHPSSRLPVYTGNFGGDHCETQRWFEKLPQYLLEKSKRPRVVSALKKALEQYSQLPEAEVRVYPE